jgi:hypothetical protein
MYLDHESLKIELKEKNLTRTVNVSDANMKDHSTRSPIASHVEWTNLGSSGAGVGSSSKDSSGGR